MPSETPRLVALSLGLLLACGDKSDADSPEPDEDTSSADTAAIDVDGDGHPATDDCDDGDAAVHPGADEVCNGVDDDCDGLVDDDDPDLVEAPTWYVDADGDGYGDAGSTSTSCEQPSGAVSDASDCDDTEPLVNPEAQEVCDDEQRDEDCDGLSDDEDPDVRGTSTWYADADGDGFGDPASARDACLPASGDVADDTDCDNGDPAVNPDAGEVCDPDDTDEDCDGRADDADVSVEGRIAWYPDDDGDGYGASSGATASCEQPSGRVADDTDCDDTDAGVNPGATEVCDDHDTDEDCDGLTDDDDPSATGQTDWYADTDADGYGDPSALSASTCEQPSGAVADDTDCDDSDAGINPGATEVCDEDDTDEDCDGLADDDDPSATGQIDWYADTDGDGYGDPTALSASTCEQPGGAVDDATDCDDTDADVNPGASEVCDEDDTDEDCDGLADDDDPSATGQTDWYADTDGDGYGNPKLTTPACDEAAGWLADDSDCDDTDADINPGGTEVCDALDTDEDCDGLADDDDPSATGQTDWYADTDGDGYGDSSITLATCEQPGGYVADPDDCDETDADVNPGVSEDCTDGVDQDCDGLLDCEDGDCATDSACTELDCEDGLDDDGDGDTDCVDDDCWSDAACTMRPVSNSIRGGHGVFARADEVRWWGAKDKWSWTNSTGATWGFGRYDTSSVRRYGTVYSLSGSMQVVRGSTLVSTCTWTLGTLRFSWFTSEWSRPDGDGSGVYSWSAEISQSTANASVSSGCATSQILLPPYLMVRGNKSRVAATALAWNSNVAPTHTKSFMRPSTFVRTTSTGTSSRSGTWTSFWGGTSYRQLSFESWDNTWWRFSTLAASKPYLIYPYNYYPSAFPW